MCASSSLLLLLLLYCAGAASVTDAYRLDAKELGFTQVYTSRPTGTDPPALIRNVSVRLRKSSSLTQGVISV